MKSDIKGHAGINIRAKIFEVWNALTKPNIFKQYFFGTDLETDWKPGRSIRFSKVWQGKTYVDKGSVLDVVKNKLIKYSYWSSMLGIEDRAENYMIVTYELSGKDNGVKLKILHENIPDENIREHAVGTWKNVLQGLKELLEKIPKPV